ncbi:unnamed protein product [Moneuplotes crassus]|uniref:Uncharacterized protein n=1 Tax=Euplotes crassus TaxID=5936 RepID=A0AAD1XLU1_EUPCR|nr:unnamed protein product [Moneuplotes crassus]
METYSQKKCSLTKGLFTKRGSCFEILVFVGYIDQWQWLMKLLCRETKEYYEKREKEFRELQKLTLGRGWEIMQQIRRYYDKEAYLPSGFDLPLAFDGGFYVLPILESIMKDNSDLPTFRSLYLRSFGEKMGYSTTQNKEFDRVVNFIDHICQNYEDSLLSEFPKIPFETIKINKKFFDTRYLRNVLSKLLAIKECKITIQFDNIPPMLEVYGILKRIKDHEIITLENMIADGDTTKSVYPIVSSSSIKKIYLKENMAYLPQGKTRFSRDCQSLYTVTIAFINMLEESSITSSLESIHLSLLDNSDLHTHYSPKLKKMLEQVQETISGYVEERGMSFGFIFEHLV